MPRFVTIGYGDQAGYQRTERSVRDAAHQRDAQLRADGALVGVAGNPVHVRNHEGAAPEPARARTCTPFFRSLDSR